MNKNFNEQLCIKQLREPALKPAAFAQIVRQYQRQIYWQIRRMVISHDDANDVMQNTFIKAWTAIDSFRADSKLSTWLYRIAVNETRTFLNQQRMKTLSSMLDLEDILVSRLEADTYFDGSAAEKKLQKAILSLPDKQRQVFNLRYFEDKSYEEMEEIFGTSVGALKASYHHAVKKIENFLQQD